MASAAPTPHAQPASELDNRRMIAVGIDMIAPVAAIGALLALGLLTAATLAVALGWTAFYFFALESDGGETIGKRVMKLRVIGADGQPPTMRQAALRNVIRIPELPLVGLLAMIAGGESRQRLGDRAAETYVVAADAAADARTAALETLAPGHVPEVAEPAPAPAEKKKTGRRSLGGPEIKLPKLGRKGKAPKPAKVKAAKPAKAGRKTLGGPEIKLPKLGRKRKSGPRFDLPPVPVRDPAPAVAEPAPRAEESEAPRVESPAPRAEAPAPRAEAPAPRADSDSRPEPPPLAQSIQEAIEGTAPAPVIERAAEPAPIIEPDVPSADEIFLDSAPEILIEPDAAAPTAPAPAAAAPAPIPPPVVPPPAVEPVVADEPSDDEESIDVKPIETVSAIDLVMQDADDGQRPGA